MSLAPYTTLPDVPLVLHSLFAEFAWSGQSMVIFSQRTDPNSHTPHEDYYYLRDHDGSYHEISLEQCREHLEHPPRANTVHAIAISWEKESQQHDKERLRALLDACRP